MVFYCGDHCGRNPKKQRSSYSVFVVLKRCLYTSRMYLRIVACLWLSVSGFVACLPNVKASSLAVVGVGRPWFVGILRLWQRLFHSCWCSWFWHVTRWCSIVSGRSHPSCLHMLGPSRAPAARHVLRSRIVAAMCACQIFV